ncbi:hypothetical protein K439DRAFT_1377316, partial [Ramaria rubella]
MPPLELVEGSNISVPPRADPLAEFEAEPEPQTQGRGQRVRRPTAYIRDIAEGQGSSTGLPRGPSLPRGIQTPTSTTDSSTVPQDSDQTRSQTFETAMATGVADIIGDDPTSIEDAKKCSDWRYWDVSVKKELKQLDDNGTWDLVEPP